MPRRGSYFRVSVVSGRGDKIKRGGSGPGDPSTCPAALNNVLIIIILLAQRRSFTVAAVAVVQTHPGDACAMLLFSSFLTSPARSSILETERRSKLVRQSCFFVS